jgi:hypothetical protein
VKEFHRVRGRHTWSWELQVLVIRLLSIVVLLHLMLQNSFDRRLKHNASDFFVDLPDPMYSQASDIRSLKASLCAKISRDIMWLLKYYETTTISLKLTI